MPGDAGREPGSHAWLDRDAGPLVRSFALTGGRARSDAAMFDLVAYVVATDTAVSTVRRMQREHKAIVARAAVPVSVAELASHVDLPLGVVRVLLGDLLQLDAITTLDHDTVSHQPDDHVLKAVIDALRTL